MTANAVHQTAAFEMALEADLSHWDLAVSVTVVSNTGHISLLEILYFRLAQGSQGTKIAVP